MLLDPVTGASPQARQQALLDVLITFTTYELIEQRAKFNLPVPNSQASYKQILAAIIADARTQDLELIGLSYVYYSYVRADSDVTYTWFAGVAGADEKTIRRGHGYVINWLTGKLQAEELTARERRRQDIQVWRNSRRVVQNLPDPIR